MSQLLLKAVNFAAEKHRNQRRKDQIQTPYINHPIQVATYISIIGGINDQEVLAAAVLHDTLEDTDTQPEILEEMFGLRVRQLVEAVTDDKTLNKAERKRMQVEHAATLSDGAILIKLGDKISNVRDIVYNPPHGWLKNRKLEYFDWAEAVINNCRKINDPLENYFLETVTHCREKMSNDD